MDHSKDNQNYTPTKRELMSASQISKMEKDTGIYFPSGKFPIKFKKVYAYELFKDMPSAPLNWHLNVDDWIDDQPSEDVEQTEKSSEKELTQSIFESSFLTETAFEVPLSAPLNDGEDLTEELEEEKKLSTNEFHLPF